MSQVVLVCEDNDDGKVDIKINFYPELDTKNSLTGAQQLALDILTYLSKNKGEKNEKTA